MHKTLNISKDFLYTQYIINKKSIRKIAKEKCCSFCGIRYNLIKNNIPIRTMSEADIGRKHTEQTKNKITNKQKGISKNIPFRYKISKEWLFQKYIIERNSTKFIANLLNCSSGVIIQRLNWFDIPIRTMAESQKGKYNSMYGKPCSNIKKILYNGIGMCSSWEVEYAKYLDKNNIKWLYEPKRFYFKDCTYLPDFYLPETDTYIEIKGWWRGDGKKKIKRFKEQYPKQNIKILMKKELEQLNILKGVNK